MSGSRPRRNRPSLPYRPVSPSQLWQLGKQRLRAINVRGPRAYEALAVLRHRYPQVASGVIYLGDVGMGRRMERHPKTAHRAKYDLLRAGIILLHCAGPRMCPCSKCGGAAAGGKILNSNGQPVSAATGYQFDPSLLVRQRPNPARPAEAAEYAPPARRQAERLRALKDQLPGRPGP